MAEAELRILFSSDGDYSGREPTREYTGTASFFETTIARSDADGRWTCTLIPRDHPGFSITAHHPNYAPTPVIQVMPGLAPTAGETNGSPAHSLWAGQLTTALNRPLQLIGRIVDHNGHPVPVAQLVH